MNILVVGGAGLVGASSALHLAELGHSVTIAGRNPPAAGALSCLRFTSGSYLADDFSDRFLQSFDGLVFAAGNDVRQLPRGADEGVYFEQANSIGVPAFFRRARAAGIRRAVYVGSYYTEVLAAASIAANGYLRSRKAADEGVRALAGEGFAVCSLQAPFMMGHVEGVRAISIEWAVRYLLGQVGPEPLWVLPGGGNFMSTRSFAEAVAGALEQGEPGKAYLVGDENWSFAHYFELMLDALGRPTTLPVHDRPHPAMPDATLYSGRGTVVSYEPEVQTLALLRYRRNDVERAVRAMVPYYRALVEAEPLGAAVTVPGAQPHAAPSPT